MKYTVIETPGSSGRGAFTTVVVRLEDGTESAPHYYRDLTTRAVNVALALKSAAGRIGVDVASLTEDVAE